MDKTKTDNNGRIEIGRGENVYIPKWSKQNIWLDTNNIDKNIQFYPLP